MVIRELMKNVLQWRLFKCGIWGVSFMLNDRREASLYSALLVKIFKFNRKVNSF